jgi:hypothetical protein
MLVDTLQPYTQAVQQLHTQLTPMPAVDAPLETVLSSQIQSELVKPIMLWLLQYSQSEDSLITGWRASTIYPLTNESSWPLVQWTENNADVMAIFKIDNGVVGCLMHSQERDTKRSSISWQVAGIDELRTLFGAAQHMFGVLQWSPQDIVELYAGVSPQDESDERYFSLFPLTLGLPGTVS